jgi:hypothetical protein
VVQWEVPPTRRIAFVAVLVVVALSVVLTVTVGFRPGGYVLGAASAAAAVMRAFLPEKYCLGLLVRSRRFDATVNALLALAVIVGAHSVPGR